MSAGTVIAYAKVIAATLTDFVILTEDSTALTLAIVMRIVITQRSTARLTRCVVHIRTVTPVAVTEFASVLICLTHRATGRTALTLHLTLVVIALAHTHAAYITVSLMHCYLIARNV